MFPLPIISNTSTVPKPPENLIFGLYNFSSVADIKDRSINDIPLTVGSSLTVGSNQHGTYMDFSRASGQSILFDSDVIKIPEYDVEIEFSEMVYSTEQSYILDMRRQTQGEQLIITVSPNANTIGTWAGGNAGDIIVETDFENTGKVKYTLKVRSTGIEIYINEVLATTSSISHPTLIDGAGLIGKSNYISSTNSFLKAKIHSFKIFSI